MGPGCRGARIATYPAGMAKTTLQTIGKRQQYGCDDVPPPEIHVELPSIFEPAGPGAVTTR